MRAQFRLYKGGFVVRCGMGRTGSRPRSDAEGIATPGNEERYIRSTPRRPRKPFCERWRGGRVWVALRRSARRRTADS
jgi:hypothetical protein